MKGHKKRLGHENDHLEDIKQRRKGPIKDDLHAIATEISRGYVMRDELYNTRSEELARGESFFS